MASGDEELTGAENGRSTWTITAEKMCDLVVTVSNYLKKMSRTAAGVDINSYYFDTELGDIQTLVGLLAEAAGIELHRLLRGLQHEPPLDIVMNNDYAYYLTFGFQEAHTQDFVDMVYKYDDSEEVKAFLGEYLRLD